MKNFGKGIDKTVFWPATIVTLLCGLLFFIFPEKSNEILNQVHAFSTHELGWFFLVVTVILLVLCLYFAFSRIGNIVLGDENDKPAYSTFTWLGMVLTSGSGGSLLYLAAIEWIWFVQDPPFGLDPQSIDAYRWASAYGMFHWGPSAWGIYVACAVPIGYFYYVKKKSNLKMSDYARPWIGKKADGFWGNLLNFLYIFSLLGGVLTSLALGTPPIASGIAYMFGMDSSNVLIDVLVIAAWTLIPLAALVIGLQKGVSKLSDWNVKGFIILLIFIVLFGPTWFIFNQSTDALGLMLQNYVYMSFQTDAIRDGGFPQTWTVFYMSWWAVYALPFGLFIAKISRGRTIRQMVIGALSAGSLGCMMFYMVLPNMGIYLQRSGTVDLFTSLAERDRGGVVVDMFSNVPGGPVVVVFFTALVLISYITGHCSVGYSLAAASEKKMKGDQDPQKWNMAFWLILAGIVSLGLYLLNPSALQPLQTVSIVTGFPICFAIGALIIAFFKQLKKDFPDGIEQGNRIYGTPEEEEE